MSLLEIKDLQVYFKSKQGKSSNVHVLENVNLTLEENEILGIVGESGCGKTTLSKSILNLIGKADGNILLEGKRNNEISRMEISEKIQMIFQNPLASFNPFYTINKSLKEAYYVHKKTKVGFEEEAKKLYQYTGLTEEMASKYPTQLSGGQLQRFAIVRALLVNPKILIADEAVAALDVAIQKDILDLLLYLRQKLHIAIIFISHDLRVIENISDRVLVMYLGSVVEVGQTKKVFNNPSHPYTRLLLASKTKSDPKEVRTRKYEFEDIPSILELGEGCRFGKRCEFAKEKGCVCQVPNLKEIEENHFVACFENTI